MKPTHNKFDAAVAHFEAGRMEAAAAICRKILVGRPKHIDALRMQGMIALRAGHARLAVKSLTKAARASGEDAQALTELGYALLQLNRLEEALDKFVRVVAIDPDAAEAHNYLGVVYRRLNRLDDAVAAYRRAIKLRPDFADALLNLGIALQSQKRLDESLRFYKLALAQMPSCARLIELNLASMGKGTLWLDPGGLQRHLELLVDDE